MARRRTDKQGPGAVRFAWVKVVWLAQRPPSVGLIDNERADKLANEGSEFAPEHPAVTEGGLRQEWGRMREAERKVKGCGMGE